MSKSAMRFPGEGSSQTFAVSPGVALVPPATTAFVLSDTLLDPGAAGFAAGVAGYRLEQQPSRSPALSSPHT